MFYFILFFLLKLLNIIISPIIYPIIYPFRWKIRTKKILVNDYLYLPRKGMFLLWAYLNDSEYLDGTNTEYGDNQKYYPAFIWKSKSDFLKSWWFNSVRNSAVNLNNWFAKHYLLTLMREHYITWSYKTFAFTSYHRYFLNIHNNEIDLRAFELRIFGKRNFIGFSHSGRFWVEVFKKIN